MPLQPGCPRCPLPVDRVDDDQDGAYACVSHGQVSPLWRPLRPDYESFAELVRRSGEVPTYVPWPMSPGWTIADFGYVGVEQSSPPVATVTTVAGTSDLDGEVELTVVSEEPGVGLGARCAGSPDVDPGALLGRGQPSVRVRAAGRQVPLWPVDVEPGEDVVVDEPLALAVFAGEASGRWLWLVLRPASAALLLADEWLLADVTGFGPEALEMPFGGRRPSW